MIKINTLDYKNQNHLIPNHFGSRYDQVWDAFKRDLYQDKNDGAWTQITNAVLGCVKFPVFTNPTQ